MPHSQLKETPSQTAGPYVHIGTVPAAAGLKTRTQERLNVLAGAGTPGERGEPPGDTAGVERRPVGATEHEIEKHSVAGRDQQATLAVLDQDVDGGVVHRDDASVPLRKAGD